MGWSVRRLLTALLAGLLILAMLAMGVQVREARSNIADRRALLETNTERLGIRFGDLFAKDRALLASGRMRDEGGTLCAALTPGVRVVRLDAIPVTLCPGASNLSVGSPVVATVPTISPREDAVLLRVDLPQAASLALTYPPSAFLTVDYFAKGLPRRELTLSDGDRFLTLRSAPPPLPFSREFEERRQVPGTPLALTVRAPLFAEGWANFAARLAPFLLWAAIALIGSLVLSRLLLRPLERLAGRVGAYRPGLPWPAAAPVSRFAELRGLEDRFVQLAERVAVDRAARDEAVAHQQDLTREVHHRVKNNLQIMASMIGLHARATTDPVARGAYALIQRRVDALAAVHRNHVAVAEGDAGILLPRLFTDLQQAFDDAIDARSIDLRIDAADLTVDQDVALPLALFVTELAEQALRLGGRTLDVTVGAHDDADGWITVAGPIFVGLDERDPAWKGTDRILRGFSRQLRRPLERTRDGAGFTLGFSRLRPRDDRTP